LKFGIEKHTLGYVLAASAALFWSTLGILGKIAYALGADPITLITLRAALATLIVGIAMVLTNTKQFKIKGRDIPFFVAYGFFGVGLNYIGYFYALQFTTVATAITLLYTYPALVVVTAFFMFHEPITGRKVAALALSFLGILVTTFGLSSSNLSWDIRGLMFGLLAGAANAAYTLAGKRSQVTYSALTVLFYSFLFGALTLCGFYLVELGPTLNISTQIMVLIVAIAFVPTLMGYGLYTLSLRFTEAGRSSVTSSIEPAAAIFLAYLFLGEIITPIQLLGTGLIILGAIILQVKK
jgi:drug/metabolite transporter (DMT)-like permease